MRDDTPLLHTRLRHPDEGLGRNVSTAERGEADQAHRLLEDAAARLDDVSEAHPTEEMLRSQAASLRETPLAYDASSPQALKRMHYSSRSLGRRKRN